MSTRIELSKAELIECAARVRSLDADDLAEKFQAEWNDATPGNHVYLRCNPRTGEAWTVETVGEECGTDEYFSEHGAASVATLQSQQRAHWEPGPDEGYEWEDCADGETSDYITDGNGEWTCGASVMRDAARLGIEIPEFDPAPVDPLAYLVKNHGWNYFRVTYTPVDGSNDLSREIAERIEELAVALETEAEISE
jgi:hypothetical protein